MIPITTTTRFGPLQEGFSFELVDGYIVLTGENDTGKSAILQLIFSNLYDNPDFGAGKICLLLPERVFVSRSTETGGRNLVQFNNEFRELIRNSIISGETYQRGPSQNELPKLLLNHTNYPEQLNRIIKYLERLELPKLILQESQLAHFDNVALQFHGSGLRSIFAILSALSDPQMKVILIDEPEISLEPKIQKALRDILLEESQDRIIVVATHSHLFINRSKLENNKIINKEGEIVSVSTITNKIQLSNLIFNLLGNSTEDLFFPGNYLIVEGASDQIIVEKVIQLMNIEASKIKVVSASGISNVVNRISAVKNVLVPLIMEDSPYSRKVVALIDKPNDSKQISDLKKMLKNRLFILETHSLEEYLPQECYERAGRNKEEDLKKIDELKNDYKELNKFKKSLSEQLASILEADDLDKIPMIRDSVKKANT